MRTQKMLSVFQEDYEKEERSVIFDTDILIWYSRGNTKAQKAFSDADKIAITAVTMMEFIQSVRNKNELLQFKKFLHANAVRVYYINEEINIHALHLLEEHFLSTGVEWGDSLIAATALYHNEELITSNTKHYRCFSNLKLHKFTP